MRSIILAVVLLWSAPAVAQHAPEPGPPAPATASAPASAGTAVTVTSKAATTVYVAFGSDSVVKASDWKAFCTKLPIAGQCKFPLAGSMKLPTGGHYLNVSLAFGAAVGCGSTKAELNVNNPNWFDILDVSLVDGYSNKIKILYTAPGAKKPVALGPPVGPTGNEKVLGVFPAGCDICIARCKPPCGIKSNCAAPCTACAAGKDGCKKGTQYSPDVVCQYQGAVKRGGGSVEVVAE